MSRGRKNVGDDWANGNDEDLPPPNHNAKDRAEIIRNACREITDLEMQRTEISTQIREIKQARIKGDLDMKIGDFNAALRLYQLEGDDRNQFFDALRETFEALGVGEQLDFLHAIRPRDAADAA